MDCVVEEVWGYGVEKECLLGEMTKRSSEIGLGQ